MGEEDTNLSLFADEYVYVENAKESTKYLLELINKESMMKYTGQYTDQLLSYTAVLNN